MIARRPATRRSSPSISAAAIVAIAMVGSSCSQQQENMAAETRLPAFLPLKAPAPLFAADAMDPREPAGDGVKAEDPAGAAIAEHGAPVGAGGASIPPVPEESSRPTPASYIEPREVLPPETSPSPGTASVVDREPGNGKPSLEELYDSYRSRFREIAGRPAEDPFSAIERADLEGRLIALFFLHDGKKLEDYREIIRSFQDDGPVNVEVELLKAALFQRVGQTDLRDRAIERARGASGPTARGLTVTNLAFAREIRGFRAFTPVSSTEFAVGEEILIYGEIEGFRNTTVERDAGTAYRRSFGAEIVLRDGAGSELDRRVLLRAGNAVELADSAAKPVHFWGRYPIPAGLSPGSYRIELEVRDVEGGNGTRGVLPLRIR